MKKYFLIILATLATTTFADQFSRLESNQDRVNTTLILNPIKPILESHAYILIDHKSGQIIAEKNAKIKLQQASLTKMMTMYIVCEHIRTGKITLDTEIAVSESAWQAPGSKMFIEPGKKISVYNLIKGIIIQSGNDASIALAEYLMGSINNFVKAMNIKAKSLGMYDTLFVNPTGLPEKSEQFSTAYDIAILSQALINDFPEFYNWYKEKEFTHNNITQYNRNKLLWKYSGVDGIKTGYTDESGFVLATSAEKDNLRLISVVLKSESEEIRMKDTIKLLDFGFQFYESHRVFESNKEIQKVRTWYAKDKYTSIGTNSSIYITIPKGSYNNLDIQVEMNDTLVAPIIKNSIIGKIIIKIDENKIIEENLIALEKNKESNIMYRFIDYAQLKIMRIFNKL